MSEDKLDTAELMEGINACLAQMYEMDCRPVAILINERVLAQLPMQSDSLISNGGLALLIGAGGLPYATKAVAVAFPSAEVVDKPHIRQFALGHVLSANPLGPFYFKAADQISVLDSVVEGSTKCQCCTEAIYYPRKLVGRDQMDNAPVEVTLCYTDAEYTEFAETCSVTDYDPNLPAAKESKN